MGTIEKDSDISKGATEQDGPDQAKKRPDGETSMSGQLGHRDQDEELKDNDTDFPEPDAPGEHTGQK